MQAICRIFFIVFKALALRNDLFLLPELFCGRTCSLISGSSLGSLLHIYILIKTSQKASHCTKNEISHKGFRQ